MRYMQEKCNINIMTDKEFNYSRDILSAKLKELKFLGMGTNKRRADPFPVAEINILHEKQLLGLGSYMLINEMHIFIPETLWSSHTFDAKKYYGPCMSFRA